MLVYDPFVIVPQPPRFKSRNPAFALGFLHSGQAFAPCRLCRADAPGTCAWLDTGQARRRRQNTKAPPWPAIRPRWPTSRSEPAGSARSSRNWFGHAGSARCRCRTRHAGAARRSAPAAAPIDRPGTAPGRQCWPDRPAPLAPGRQGRVSQGLFDRLQLEAVIRICRESSTLSDAGRRLFDHSRTQRTVVNDADRLRKYLMKFGLTWEKLRLPA